MVAAGIGEKYPRWKAREGMNVRVSVGALRLLPAGENFPLRAHIRPSDQYLLRKCVGGGGGVRGRGGFLIAF